MKLIMLLYLEDDEPVVDRLLEEHRVAAFSRLPLEGHGAGVPAGWYGEISPYRSKMVFTFVPAEGAEDLMGAVRDASGLQDPRHPIHAVQVAVEGMAHSGVPRPSAHA